MIGVVDYGIGNLASLTNMFDYLGFETKVVSELADIESCDKLVLPGVGAFDAATRAISLKLGLQETLTDMAMVREVPFLGVCLGMQLMMTSSAEGESNGFGWIPGRSEKILSNGTTRVPHIGWHRVEKQRESPLLVGHLADDEYYFVHSYGVTTDNDKYSIGTTEYGSTFDSVVQKDNLFGVQFHPEKSHKYGMKILSNFGEL